MSSGRRATGAAVRRYDDALGYLLKHAHLELERRTDSALAELDVTTRDLGVLRVIAGAAASSQQGIADVLGVDRTSMVGLLDALERKGIVARRPSEEDRRRNVIELTADGRHRFDRAEEISVAVETDFTSVLGARRADELRSTLRGLLRHPSGD